MKTINPTPVILQTISPLFRKQAHLLLFRGYQQALSKIKSVNEEETAITGYICKAITNCLRDSNPPRWYKNYSIKDDPPIETEKRMGKNRLRLDIIIEANWVGRPEYCFEAKRLRKNGFPVSKYIGISGMGCFITALYASRYKEAAMIGYIQDDSIEIWQDKIKKAINKQKETLQLIDSQQDIEVIDQIPCEWISVHNRSSLGYSITIYHILLNCVPV